MNKKLLAALFLTVCIVLSATPYYPGGIPSKGPLKGQVTFWGEDSEGNYFDGVSYGTDYEISIPGHGKMKMSIHLSEYFNGTEPNKNINISFEKSIKGFNGEVNIKAVNPDKTVIIRNYRGNPKNDTNYGYSTFFDFEGVDEKAAVTLELILENEKKISVRLGNSVSKDLISISRLFPEKK